MPFKEIIVARHSIRPDADHPEVPEYPGLSAAGVELARVKAQEIWSVIQQSPADTVVLIGGVSEAARTRSTARALALNLRQLAGTDALFISQDDLALEAQQNVTAAWRFIQNAIAEHPNTRVIVEYPLFLKQLSLVHNGWLDEQGNDCPFFVELMAQNGGDRDRALIDWAANGGVIDGVVGPSVAGVGAWYSQAIQRTVTVAEQLAPNRSILPLIIGHSWDVDALLGYVAGGGQIDLPIFNEVVAAGMIKPLEYAVLDFSDQSPTVTYRGARYLSAKESE